MSSDEITDSSQQTVKLEEGKKWLKNSHDEYRSRIKLKRQSERAKRKEKAKLMKNVRQQFIDTHQSKEIPRQLMSRRMKSEFFLHRMERVKEMGSNCLTIVIDCSFGDLMNEKTNERLAAQLMRCHSINKTVQSPSRLMLTSIDGATEKQLRKNNCHNWQEIEISSHYFNHIISHNYDDETMNEKEIFDKKTIEHFKNRKEEFKKKIIYLCAESENVLNELDVSEKIYVIGGLLDHNSHKGHCYKVAKEFGYGHARLPIDQFMILKTRHVLTINQVFEMLLHKHNGMEWNDVIEKIVPTRKGGIMKTSENFTPELNDEEEEIESSPYNRMGNDNLKKEKLTSKKFESTTTTIRRTSTIELNHMSTTNKVREWDDDKIKK
ncbi:hypothetical protein SNEBB_009996 [Seison nebaliae]|nr:hypothetical protein SNEBB_009996 [Seison nebaliae]